MSREVLVWRDGGFVTKSVDGVLTDEYLAYGHPTENPFHHYGSDYLPGGVNGMLSHADGKRYDSKSAYRRSLRERGCREVGNDFNDVQWKSPLERGIRGDFNVRPQLKEALEKVLK